MKPEVLFLSHRIPYPPDKGDKIRSWHVLKHLAGRYRVQLCAFVDDPADMRHKPFLEGVCESVALIPLDPRWSRIKSLSAVFSGDPLTFRYFQSREMQKAVAAARAHPLVMEYAFSSAMAPYIEQPMTGRKRVVDFCDADSEKWRDYSKGAAFPLAQIYACEGRLLAREETRIANWADASFAISPEEARIFNERPGIEREVGWFANGVDADYYAPGAGPASDKQFDCVFVGAMDYRANVDGVLAFVRQVWPGVRAAKPDARFAIVGANPSPDISKLDGHDGIVVTGRAEDVRPYLSGAKISVAPLRVARGVQNKVLEAMAMGKAVVATAGAMTGIAAERACAEVAPLDGMAAAIVRLLGDDPKRAAMGAAAHALVVERYSWPASLARLDGALTKLGL
ncbi:MAG: TIGR03087 family PEP-CTERM/XrtA system glycosyltransferase [Parvularculaceae bacterium]